MGDGAAQLYVDVAEDRVESLAQRLAAEPQLVHAMLTLNNDEATPLYVAAQFGSLGALQLLLEKGGDPTTESRQGSTPLHAAAASGHALIVECLIDRNDVDVDVVDYRGKTPLHVAVEHNRSSIVPILAAAGADVNAVTDFDNRSALHLAAIVGDATTMLELLVAGATPAVVDDLGYTPVHLAAYHNAADLLPLLQEYGADLDAHDEEAGVGTPLQVAAAENNMDAVHMLLELDADFDLIVLGDSALTIAARHGHDDIVRAFIDAGATVRFVWSMEESPLAAAAAADRASTVQLLLDAGVRVDESDRDRQTALMKAAAAGAAAAVQVLLDAGADRMATDRSDRTAAAHAAANGHSRLAALLATY